MSQMDVTAGAEAMAYAGFWRRFLAGLIDFVILLIPTFILATVTGFALFASFTDPTAAAGVTPSVAYLVPVFLIWWGYKAILESSSWQATIGKKALGLKVTTIGGEKLSIAQATMRTWPFWLGALIQIFESVAGMGGILSGAIGLISVIALIVIAFTPKKQGVHDMMAKTLVVR